MNHRKSQHKAPPSKRKGRSGAAAAPKLGPEAAAKVINKKPGSVRIVGGIWRGSKLPVVGGDELRPSGDRGRETLFNWLAPNLVGSKVLDLFAGSGALGLEAASRGAAEVTLLEADRAAAQSLQATASRLLAGAGQPTVQVVHSDALEWLIQHKQSFDLVLIDPPFSKPELYQLSFERLETQLTTGSLVYVESSRDQVEPQHPSHWQLTKQKQLGQIRLQLLRVGAKSL